MSEHDVTTVAGEAWISRQLLADAGTNVYDRIITFAFDPRAEEKAAERRRDREVEWDAKTAEGLIGLQDNGEDTPDWDLAPRGDFVQIWTTPEKWQNYQAAAQRLAEAEDDL